MSVLVTGGAGFLGHHLVRTLLQKGDNVIVLDSMWTGYKENLSSFENNPNFSYVVGDVRKTLPQFASLKEIYHLACPASPDHFETRPLEILETCFQGTKNVLELALKHKARLLLASTSETYGDPLVVPQSEKYWGNVNCFGPRSCYDEGKRVAESLVYAYRAKYNLDVRVARIFNAYGPHMKFNDGRAVPNFIAAAMENKPIIVYGDGNATRCFQLATDCIRGLVALMESDYIGPVNIGSDRETPIGEIASTIARAVANKLGQKEPVPINFLPKRQDDPVRRKPDISLAKEVLGWSPQVPLEEGLETTIEWFLSTRQSRVNGDKIGKQSEIKTTVTNIIPSVSHVIST
ncbi:UDP-glucuronic acid decarboxylase [Paramyrothecium foliicola]|nr:UDP-glucuronic acid decarboxylase [Paramyrothecium foliicola]